MADYNYRLNLNDFKAVLGQVNDGDVKMNKAGKLVKINYGGALTRFRHVGATSVEENRALRKAFMQAIVNSREGRALSQEALNQIRRDLGLSDAHPADGAQGADGTACNQPLTRLAISQILARVAGEDPNETFETMVAQDVESLKARGVHDEAGVASVKDFLARSTAFASPDALGTLLKGILPKTFRGFPRSTVLRMVKDNFAQFKETVFLRLYSEVRLAKAANDPVQVFEDRNLKVVLYATIRDLMAQFANHGEGVHVLDSLIPMLSGTEADRAAVFNNPQLTSFKDGLDSFDQLVDALFPKSEALPDVPTFSQLNHNRMADTLKYALRKELGTAMAQNKNDAAQALKSPNLKSFAVLLRSPAGLVDTLKGDAAAFEKLQELLFDKVLARRLGSQQDAPKTLLEAFAAKLKPITDPFDPEVHLKTAFGQSGIDGSQYEMLKEQLMPNGVLDAQILRCCTTMAKDDILNVVARMCDPDADRTMSNNAIGARDSLVDAFRAAKTRLSEGAEARKELIENFDTKWQSGRFPAFMNTDAFKAFRSKAALMGEVIPLEQRERLREDGLELHPNDTRRLLFKIAGKDLVEYSKLTDERLTDDEKKQLTNLARKYEAILDKAFEHIPVYEIEARKQYAASNVGTIEPMIAPDQPILAAMRDRLIPKNISPEACLQFTNMYLNVHDNILLQAYQLSLTDFETVETIKAEFDTTLSCLKTMKGSGAGKRLQTMFTNACQEKKIDPKADQKPLNEADARKLRLCYKAALEELRKEGDQSMSYSGFGTRDIKVILDTFAQCGIDICKLGEMPTVDEQGKLTPPDLDRARALMQVIDLRGGKIEGVAEWFVRVSGKPISELSRKAVAEMIASKAKDPVDGVKENTEAGKVVRFLRGDYSLAQSGLDAAGRFALAGALRQLVRHQVGDPGAPSAVTVKLGGCDVTLSLDAKFRKLTGTVAIKGKALPIPLPFEASDLLVQTENAILDHLESLGQDEESKNQLLDLLPGPEDARRNISRAREIFARVISKLTGQPSVALTAMTLEGLRETAIGLVRGTIQGKAFVPPDDSAYNSQEAIELGQAMRANEAGLQRIAWPGAVEAPVPPKDREGVEPSAETIRDLAADLIMNKNTWTYDLESGSGQGERMLKVLQGYAPEVRYILNHPESLDVLAPTVRDGLKAILAAVSGLAEDIGREGVLESIDVANQVVKDRLAELDTTATDIMTRTMTELQAMVSELFVGQNGNQTDLWKVSPGVLNGTGGLDVTTAHGKFVKAVLDDYFAGAAEVDKRAMFSAFIRNVKPDDSVGKQVGELIKGAGPLLQKMLQGLPVETFPKETQAALQDTRSNLAPIPAEVVNARLLNMIANSNGYITKIEVTRSLGAASVGQAFLCRIYTKDRPLTGDEVVVKILRPNVETASRREYARFMEIAKRQNNGEDQVLADYYRSVQKEFDFTVEAGNIDRGAVYHHGKVGLEPAKDVLSMGRYKTVQPTTGALVLQKVEGKPFSNFTRDARKLMNEILDPLRREYAVEEDGPKKVLLEAKTSVENWTARMKLNRLHDAVVARRKNLSSLVQMWFQQAFEGGFIHGDMHSGNIMAHDKGATVIDFGNALFMSEAERKAILASLAACVFGECTNGSDPGQLILSCIKSAFAKDPKANDVEAAMNNANLKADLRVVLSRGAKSEVATRLLSALTVLKKYGCPIPECFTQFTQSLTRLQASLMETDELLSEIEEQCEEIGVTEDWHNGLNDPDDPLTKKEGGITYFQDFDRFLPGGLGLDGQAVDYDLQRRLESPDVKSILGEIKEKNPDLLTKNNGLDFVDMVMKKYDNLKTARWQTTDKGVKIMHVSLLSVTFERALEAHKKLISDRAAPEVLEDSRNKIHEQLIKSFSAYISELDVDRRYLQPEDHTTLVTSFEECGFDALETVLNLYMDTSQGGTQIGKAKQLFCDTLGMATGAAFSISLAAHAQGYYNKDEDSDKQVKALRQEASDASKPETYVDRRTRRLLEGLAREFLMPPDGITSQNVKDVARTNLDRILQKLGKSELTDAEIRYFVRLVDYYNWRASFGLLTKYTSPFENLKSGDGKTKGADFFAEEMKTEIARPAQMNQV